MGEKVGTCSKDKGRDAFSLRPSPFLLFTVHCSESLVLILCGGSFTLEGDREGTRVGRPVGNRVGVVVGCRLGEKDGA